MLIRPNVLDPKYAANYLYAKEISKELEDSQVSPEMVRSGDFIVANLDNSDKIGVVAAVKIEKSAATIFLKDESFTVKLNQPIYIVQRGTKMELNDHTTYERDLTTIKPNENKAQYAPTTCSDHNVDDGKTSEFPAAKKLSLRQRNIVVGSKVTLRGKTSNVIEIIDAEGIYKPMAVLQDNDGNIGAEFLSDLE